MPFLRRGRRRVPFRNSRWQQRAISNLRLHLAPPVRTTLTAWMKIYGETNDLPGLATGPIEVRFRRLREHAGADTLLLWTTPERWSAGEALSLWIPAIGLDLDCRFAGGGLMIDRARPTTDDDRDPRKVKSAVGMELRPEHIELPPPDQVDEANGAGYLESAFERLVGRRWSGFVAPLREALEAEAREDAARAERLATGYARAAPRIGGPSESDPYRLSGVEASAAAAFDEGEWLDLLDQRGRVISSARLVRADPAEGILDVDARGAEPPSTGTVRPRPQTQILAQKRAILDELDSPTGGLRDAVRLVASPASLSPPVKRRPPTFINHLVMRNRSQVRAVSLALGLDEGQALMIQGPPGTGKSTTLAEIVGQIVSRDPNATILVCSHSNHGVDNLLLKTVPYLDAVDALQVARVGLYDRVHPDARAHFVPPGEDLGAYNVVFTTVDALALQPEAGARTYDYAVLDEANRASILDSLIPLVRGRRFILVGDHLQLQPVLSEAEEQLRLEPAVARASAIGKSLFAWLRERRFPEAATVFLDEQNRMHPVIAGLISEVFYEGRLRSGPRAPRRTADLPLFPAPITWVDTRGLHGLREARGRGASLMNVPEARLVATIARHVTVQTAGRDLDVGVIAAYAEQTALLRRLLQQQQQRGPAAPGGGPNGAAARGSGPGRSLEVDTVDAFEGREKDVVIVSLVRSNRRRDIGFLRLMQRINVALSRARRTLIIVGDASTLRGSYFDRIIRYIRANGMVAPGPRLIGRLLNARATEREALHPPRRRRPLPRVSSPRPGGIPPELAFPGISATGPRLPTGAAPEDGADAAGAERRGRRRRRRGRRRVGPADQPTRSGGWGEADARRNGEPDAGGVPTEPGPAPTEPGPAQTDASPPRTAGPTSALAASGGELRSAEDGASGTMRPEQAAVRSRARRGRSQNADDPVPPAIGDGAPDASRSANCAPTAAGAGAEITSAGGPTPPAEAAEPSPRRRGRRRAADEQAGSSRGLPVVSIEPPSIPNEPALVTADPSPRAARAGRRRAASASADPAPPTEPAGDEAAVAPPRPRRTRRRVTADPVGHDAEPDAVERS